MLKPDFDFDYWGMPVYNLMGAAGVLCALLVFLRRERELCLPGPEEDRLNSALIISGAFSLLPANAANWVFKPELRALPLLQRFLSGGLTFYYGMFGFFGMFALLLRLWKLDARLWLGEAVPPVLIFHAFGRIGCALAGCCYGRAFDPPAVIFGFRLSMFPAREIEAVCLFALFFVFHHKIKRDRFRLYLLCYSAARFFIEFGRGDYRGVFMTGCLSPAQVTSVIVWVCLTASLCAGVQMERG